MKDFTKTDSRTHNACSNVDALFFQIVNLCNLRIVCDQKLI